MIPRTGWGGRWTAHRLRNCLRTSNNVLSLARVGLDEQGEPDPSFVYFAAAHQPIPKEYAAFLPTRSLA